MEPIKLEENWRNPDGTWKPGHPDNGAGRPKGKTMKEFAREFLMAMSDEAKREWLRGISEDTVWKMAEGNPHQSEDSTVKVIMPKPIDDVFKDSSVQEDKGTQQTS